MIERKFRAMGTDCHLLVHAASDQGAEQLVDDAAGLGELAISEEALFANLEAAN